MSQQQEQQQQQPQQQSFHKISSPSDLPSNTLSTTSSNDKSTTQPRTTNVAKPQESTTTSRSKESSPTPSINKVSKPIKKKSKKLCHFKNCSSPHSIIGDCSFCFKKFCTRHRLLEAHDCEHYREVKNDYHERNAKQLQSQQTVVSKV